jgi:hypothetical protein
MTNFRVMTDKNVCLNFPPSLLEGGNGKEGMVRIRIPKDALSSLIRENQRCSLTLENSRRIRGRIREIAPGAGDDNLVLSLKVEKQKETL